MGNEKLKDSTPRSSSATGLSKHRLEQVSSIFLSSGVPSRQVSTIRVRSSSTQNVLNQSSCGRNRANATSGNILLGMFPSGTSSKESNEIIRRPTAVLDAEQNGMLDTARRSTLQASKTSSFWSRLAQSHTTTFFSPSSFASVKTQDEYDEVRRMVMLFILGHCLILRGIQPKLCVCPP